MIQARDRVIESDAAEKRQPSGAARPARREDVTRP